MASLDEEIKALDRFQARRAALNTQTVTVDRRSHYAALRVCEDGLGRSFLRFELASFAHAEAGVALGWLADVHEDHDEPCYVEKIEEELAERGLAIPFEQRSRLLSIGLRITLKGYERARVPLDVCWSDDPTRAIQTAYAALREVRRGTA